AASHLYFGGFDGGSLRASLSARSGESEDEHGDGLLHPQAVFDKLQRVGFSFHDRLSTGQLINRALSDLQNVRQFINSAILVNGEIVLIVGGYIILLAMRSPWVAMLA